MTSHGPAKPGGPRALLRQIYSVNVRTETRREDLMSPDLLGEIVRLGSAALMIVASLLIVAAALRQAPAMA
jgi:hypothetical protein